MYRQAIPDSNLNLFQACSKFETSNVKACIKFDEAKDKLVASFYQSYIKCLVSAHQTCIMFANANLPTLCHDKLPTMLSHTCF